MIAALCMLLQAGTVYASALSELGLVMGTWRRGADMYSLYLEDAFVSSQYVRGCYCSTGQPQCLGPDLQQLLQPGCQLDCRHTPLDGSYPLVLLCSTTPQSSTWLMMPPTPIQVHTRTAILFCLNVQAPTAFSVWRCTLSKGCAIIHLPLSEHVPALPRHPCPCASALAVASENFLQGLVDQASFGGGVAPAAV